MYNYKTLQAFEMGGRVLGWAVLACLLLTGFAGFTLVVLRRTYDKTVTGTYSAMLIIALIGYIAVTYKVSSLKSKLL